MFLYLYSSFFYNIHYVLIAISLHSFLSFELQLQKHNQYLIMQRDPSNYGNRLSPDFTKKNKPDRGFVSMQQALSYLQAMNKKNAFQSAVLPVQHIQPRQLPIKSQLKSPSSKSRKSNNFSRKAEQEGVLQRKQVNKNRAIKRIIQTSMQILKNHYRGPPQISDARSSTTQFHIYLKQYNRVLGRIFLKEENGQKQLVTVIDKQENVLQKVNNFVVFEDFRDIVPSVLLKSKINKQNIEMMMDAFKDSLIALKNNQLKVYQSLQPSGRFRSIKLAQIQNVDYHSQPYFFMIITIVKDKSKPHEYLYFKMKSLAHQDKWDRALYCNYILRKMKNKHYMFQKDYPAQEETKKREEIMEKQKNDYQLSRKNVVREVYGDMKRTLSDVVEEDNNNMDGVIGLTNNFSKPHELSIMLETPNREQQFFQTKSHPQSKQLQDPEHSPNTQRSHTRKLSMFEDRKLQNRPQTPLAKTQMPSTFSKGNKLNSINEQPIIFRDNQPVNSQKISVNNKQDVQINGNSPPSEINPSLSKSLKIVPIPMQKEKDKRKQIQQKYPQGFTLKKNKFFGSKLKLIEFNLDHLIYWDYDQKTKQKTEKKTIFIKSISQITNNKVYIEIVHENSKYISFIGNENIIKDLQEWIKLYPIR